MAKKKSAKRAASNSGAAPRKVAKKKKRHIEQYDHADAKRVNNPPVGLVTPETDPPASARKTYQYDPHLDPQLVWAGKAEHTSFQVPTVSLHVHERIDPRTIMTAVRSNGNGAVGTANGAKRQQGLFENPEETLPRREAIEFYKHAHGWSNRLVAGDSLLVMNSLLEKEGMAGKVQMIYIDPPYGIRYGSNFQPFVHQRDVKDRKDEDLTAEPEMLRAFRDTWELGIHSYLAYLRDRLLLARELLHESGSVFVQIGDENLHHVRSLCAEIFRTENHVATITFKTSIGLGSSNLDRVCDHIVWFAKDIRQLKYRQLFQQLERGEKGATRYNYLELPDGSWRTVTAEEQQHPERIPRGARFFTDQGLTSRTGEEKDRFDFEYEGQSYRPRVGKWRTNLEGMKKLAAANRIFKTKSV
jgi:adenine-specific DNA-methyltransferase